MDDMAGHDHGCRRSDPAVDELLACTRETIAEAARHGGGRIPDQEVDTLERAADLLAAGAGRLQRVSGERAVADPGARADALELVVRMQSLRLAIGDVRLRRRGAASTELHRSVTRLRAVGGASELVREIPEELGRLGYSRALVSALRGTRWTPRAAFAHGDASLATALVEVGALAPGRIGREQPETDMVRGRSPVLVRDAQNTPHIHRELISLADTRDYAAAPVVAHGSVVGLLHVDRYSQTAGIDADDRDLLGLFADAVGIAFERVRYQERLQALKGQLESQLTGIDDAMYGSAQWTSGEFAPAAPGPVVRHHLEDGPLGELTRRELDVLRHLAGGASNHAIAERLGVSTGTVKTHMKQILRKLGAANRADAAARFHHIVRSSTGG